MSFCFGFDASSTPTATASANTDELLPWKRRKVQTAAAAAEDDPQVHAWSSSLEPPTSAAQRLVQYLWHFDMINDRPRNAAYSGAIKATIAAIAGTDRVNVIDIGTGTGLLALLAARAGASSVGAIEVEGAVAKIARRNVARNQLEGIVHVSHGHSTSRSVDVGDAAPATLLVAELLDSGLLGEQFIPALHDAHARGWLSAQPPCRVVPSRARVTAQLIESPYLAATCRLDAQRLGYQLPDGCEDGAAWRIQPYDCPLATLLRTGQARALSAPFPAWEISFENLPPSDGRQEELLVPVTSTGLVHAIAFWWECDLDDAGSFTVDNRPLSASVDGSSAVGGGDGGASASAHDHQDHWLQAFTYVGGGVKARRGQTVNVSAHHNDETIWFELDEDRGKAISSSAVAAGFGAGGGSGDPAADTYEIFDDVRIAQLNDSARTAAFRAQLRGAIERVVDISTASQAPLLTSTPTTSTTADQNQSTSSRPSSQPVLLHLGDGPLLPLVLADLLREIGVSATGDRVAPRAMSIEGSEATHSLSMQFLAANGLARLVSMHDSSSCEPALLLQPKSISILTAEPYFASDPFSKTWGRAALLRYWLGCAALRPYLTDDATLLPATATLRVAPVECLQLWRARQPVREAVEGVDVAAINELHSFDKVDTLALWRHPHTLLGPPTQAMRMQMESDPTEAAANAPSKLRIERSGTCHALVLWIEYAASAGAPWCDAAPSYKGEATPAVQGIVYLEEPRQVCQGDELGCITAFDARAGVLMPRLA